MVEKSTTNMKSANVIVNVDFPSYDMNKLNVNHTSLVICGFAEHYEREKNFDGIVIRKIDVIDPENSNQGTMTDGSFPIDDLSLCEAKIYRDLRKIKQNDRAFEREGFQVNGYYGENGKIMSQDFVQLGRKIVSKTS